MFGNVWRWAGSPRRENLNIGVPWHLIEIRLQDLLADLSQWEIDWPSVLEQAVHLHYRAVCIHPFKNGNGRWSRMLGNIWLRLHGHPITMWPEPTIGAGSVVRAEYLGALKCADEASDMAPLVELHKRFSEAT
jgi:fido (protein-threonine AMPylation protein)